MLLELLARRQIGGQLRQGRQLGLVGPLLLVLIGADLLKYCFVLSTQLVLLIFKLVLLVSLFLDNFVFLLKLHFKALSESIQFLFVLPLLFGFLLRGVVF